MAIAIFGFVLAPLAVLAVAMRFYSRISISRELGVDDWLMLVGAGLVVTIIGINTHSKLTKFIGKRYCLLSKIASRMGSDFTYGTSIPAGLFR